jgi:CubicO group peptidase (beta-lactamase class C family)
MASVSKTFVATALSQLREEGKLDLDAPVTRYLPYFRVKADEQPALTVRQMLAHRSGMPDVDNYGWDRPQHDPGALERYVRSLERTALVEAPGVTFRYSNMAFDVLGDVIAKVAGVPFEEQVRERLLEPLAMRGSTFALAEVDRSSLAAPHILGPQYQPEVSAKFPYNRIHAPSSTLYSSANDMCRWALAALGHGAIDGRRLLSASAYDVMWAPSGADRPDAALGWFLGEHGDLPIVRHGGSDVGFASNLVLVPHRGIAVVIMTNLDQDHGWEAIGQPPLHLLTRAALDVALGREPTLDLRLPAARMLDRALAKDGLESALNRYRELREKAPDRYDFGEVYLRKLAKRLIHRGKRVEADAVLGLADEERRRRQRGS